MVDLGTLGGTRGLPTGVNNRGKVIGQSNLAGDQATDPFFWDGAKMIDMSTAGVGGSFIVANGINDAGEIVGSAAFPNHPFDAAIWKSGVVTDLGALPGDCFSEALVINSKGQVVGGSFPCDFSSEHAFLWENGTMFDLTALIPPSPRLRWLSQMRLMIAAKLPATDCPQAALTLVHAVKLTFSSHANVITRTTRTVRKPPQFCQRRTVSRQSRLLKAFQP